ncbi:MAG TPA: prolyl oligopeptidase family serine peptidase, partial [Bryobacteraceae bacterium]|nr:prolyl oligopeptidase family serine peptidase [Bryobacteraceae bacterium]
MKQSPMFLRMLPGNIAVCCGLALFSLAGSAQTLRPPIAEKRPVTDTYHGVNVVDDYRWLEDFQDPQVKKWVAAENEYTRSELGKIQSRAKLASEMQAIVKQASLSRRELAVAGAKLFAVESRPPREQPELVVFPSAGNLSVEKTVLDPLQMDPAGHTSIDFYKPSRDGRYVAVSLSKSGSEAGDVHVFDVATGKELAADVVPRVNNGTAGGSVAWDANSTGFYYTRYPRVGERSTADLNFYQQIYFHKLGTSGSDDRYETGKEFPRIAEIVLNASEDGRWILATVANGDGGDAFHYIRGLNGTWTQLTHYSDQITSAAFGPDDSLYLLSRKNASMGKVLRLSSPDQPMASAQTVVPESDVAIEQFVPVQGRLYVVDLTGGPSQIRMFTSTGKPEGLVPLGGIVSVSAILRFGHNGVLFQTTGYLQPGQWFSYSMKSAKPELVPALNTPSPISLAGAEVIRDFAVSKDGTRIPLNIIRLKNTKLDGRNPVLLSGYGGYNISRKPRFSSFNRLLLDRGFVIVDTNLRGGSEYGEKWRLAGNLTHKQNVFDDFYACAQYLVSHGYTTPRRLGIEGGSNGGLLMGAALVQHPEMYRVVLAFVGIYDMLRAELSPNGVFNITEYGTVKELDQFKSLFAYSPYHHVADDKTYPAAIFLTGDNDPRVDPANSRKMVARLQAVGRSKGPILLRTSGNAGHGIGSSLSESLAQRVDA